ncbi:MAG: hypothetical protein NTV04_21385 [Deltaproteobacteria bacterium]|jgi:hypothetical protein|nr:hypothetical protein [Deltaproteobacteria bacterium]
MRKTSDSKNIAEMRSEYKFDYRKARPNRFAGRINRDRVVVVLDADISKVFTTAESVNTALRELITAMPKGKSQKDRKQCQPKNAPDARK